MKFVNFPYLLLIELKLEKYMLKEIAWFFFVLFFFFGIKLKGPDSLALKVIQLLITSTDS